MKYRPQNGTASGLTDMVSLVITMIALYAINAKKKAWQKQITVLIAGQEWMANRMDDLISRQSAVEACLRYNGVGWVWSKILDEIKEIPSAVVRCKDCKWYKKNYSWNGKEFKICVREPTEPARRPDDFCSYGERKDG